MAFSDEALNYSGTGISIQYPTSSSIFVQNHFSLAGERNYFDKIFVLELLGMQKKRKSNRHNYRVSFEEAATVFRDKLSVTSYDPDHSTDEDLFVTLGISKESRLLVVSHTEQGKFIRIISSRMAFPSPVLEITIRR